MTKILHLSDLHIMEPHGAKEHLRDGFFEEYLKGLFAQIKLRHSNIDILAITGDLIDSGRIVNFKHSCKIIDRFVSELNIDRRNIFIAPGNHDKIRDHEIIREFELARNDFKETVSTISSPIIVDSHVNRIATHYLSLSGLNVLVLDSTYNAVDPGFPGDMLPEEVDDIIGWIRPIPQEDHLLIISHFPANSGFAQYAAFDEEDPDWYKKHIWSNASQFHMRLKELRTGTTLWLCGDIHLSKHIAENNFHCISCGRLGGIKASQSRRQVKIITVDNSNITTDLFTYEPNGHSDSAQLLGEWIYRPSTGSGAQQIPSIASEQTGRFVDVIDKAVENDVINIIRDNKYYHFGRFHTSKERVSLSWVTVGPLLNDRIIYYAIVDSFKKYVRVSILEKFSYRPEDIVIIGIDCWGSILASHLSMNIFCKNYCVATRARGSFSHSTEIISETVIEAIKQSKAVVMISDVVRTGESFKFIHSEVSSKVHDVTDELKWFGLSIICDELQKYVDDFRFLCANAAIVKSLRMPVVESITLPDTKLLPNIINFFPNQ